MADQLLPGWWEEVVQPCPPRPSAVIGGRLASRVFLDRLKFQTFIGKTSLSCVCFSVPLECSSYSEEVIGGLLRFIFLLRFLLYPPWHVSLPSFLVIKQEFFWVRENFLFSFIPPEPPEEQVKSLLVKLGVTEEERNLNIIEKWLTSGGEVTGEEECTINPCEPCHHFHCHHHRPHLWSTSSSPALSLFSPPLGTCVDVRSHWNAVKMELHVHSPASLSHSIAGN